MLEIGIINHQENFKLTKVSSSKLSRSKDSFRSPGLFGFVLQTNATELNISLKRY